MNKAIFLDRDGVINKHRKDYVKSITELVFLPNIEKWVKIFSQHKFKIIIVTNQSVIGRGLATKNDIEKIHQKILDHFNSFQIKIDAIYFCPHTPNSECMCRKPKTKLFEMAINEFDIDILNSWVIGDSDSDIQAGQSLGCKTLKIPTNSDLEKYVSKIIH